MRRRRFLGTNHELKIWEDGWWHARYRGVSLSYQGRSFRWSPKGTHRLVIRLGDRFRMSWGFDR